jgi:hypothetical protein
MNYSAADVPDDMTQSNSTEMSSAPPGAQPSDIPDLLKIGSVDTNTAISVDSDILDPVISNSTFMRYRLQNKGILHSNSKLTFSVEASGGTGAFFPLNVGIMSLIERCRLVVGTKTLCETQDFAHFAAFRSMFVNPEHNKQRESITTSRQMARKWDYFNGSNASTNGAESNTNAEDFIIDVGRDIDAFGKTRADADTTLFKYQLIENKPVFQIPLSELFPFLKMNQLPLYMLREEVTIELFFNSDPNRACIKAGGTSSATYTINRDDCALIADYIYYPTEMMEAYANANRNMSFSYVDYRIARHTVSGASGTQNEFILNVGGAGRVVNKLFFGLSTSGNGEDKLFNNYAAKGVEGPDATGASTDRVGKFIHNIKYNDNLLYPVDINNNARLFHNITQAEGGVPFISKSEYTGEGDLISTSKFMGRTLTNTLLNEQFYVEDRLNRGERVNSRGIELYNTYNYLQDDSASAKTYTLRCWLELVRFASLRDGYMDIGFA